MIPRETFIDPTLPGENQARRYLPEKMHGLFNKDEVRLLPKQYVVPLPLKAVASWETPDGVETTSRYARVVFELTRVYPELAELWGYKFVEEKP